MYYRPSAGRRTLNSVEPLFNDNHNEKIIFQIYLPYISITLRLRESDKNYNYKSYQHQKNY